ncbi:MAG: gliding motility-associated C-terminal domain-containing protein [Cyclobacteriaceae bacterium]|nr:gliding motility-associated C-terminal domain-containing protein [Cyclobacteriaceae bacterium]
MSRILLFFIGAFIFCATASLAQPVFTIQNKKDACDGLANGSFEVLVSSANTPPLRVFVFGPPDFGPINATVGVPVPITGLPGTVGGKSYLIIVQDADGSTPFFVNIFSITTDLSASLNTTVNNSNCSTPDGSIDINVSGGTTSYSYSWTGPNGFTANTQDISGLSGGTYNVTVFDNGTNCFRTLAPITLTDPSPTIQNVTTASPLVVCAGSNAQISLNTTEVAPVNYEVIVNGNPSGVSQPGTGGPITLTLPSGTFINGDVLAIRAINGSCTPVNMNGIVIVSLVPLPIPTLSGTASLCQGTTGVVYSTEAGQSNYVWNISAGGTITSGGTITDNTATVTWNTAGPQTISVSYTNPSGCPAAAPTVLNVTVNPLPVPTIAGTTSVCQGATGIVYTTEAGQSNYTWSISAGGTITSGGTATDNTVTITWNSAGPQTVSVNYQNAFSCTAVTPTIQNVTVNAPPVPTLGGSVSVCLNTPSNVYTTDAGQSNYVWNVSAGGTITAGGSATDNSITITWTTLGPKTVSVSYTDVNGCTPVAPTISNITVNPLPAPTLTGSLTACAGTSGVVYSTEAGQSNYVWTVSAGGSITTGGTATDNTVTVTWNIAGPQSVSVNYNNAFGCPALSPTVLNITVNPQPLPTITGPISACVGSIGNVYSTEAGQSNYIWNVSAGGTITAGGGVTDNSVTVTWNTAGARTVSVSYTDPNGCTPVAPSVSNITVNTLPAPTISGSTIVCSGTTGVVYSTDPGQSNYVWTVSAGGTITAGGTVTDNTVTVTWNTAGPQSVTVNYTDANGCAAATATVLNVTINASPVPTITGPTTVCVGTTGVVYTTEAGQSNYVWAVSAGGSVTSGGTATDNTVTVTWNTDGPQTVSVNYTNSASCVAVAPTTSNIAVSPLPVPTLTGLITICAGTTGVVYATDPGQSNYVWTISAGGTVTAGGGAANNTVTITWNTPGPQTVSVNYTDGNGCTAAAATVSNVTVNPIPTPSLAGATVFCAGTTGVVYSTEAGQANYVWAISAGGTITSGGTATDNTVTVSWITSGPQTVSVNYTNASGCPAPVPTILNVTVNPLPLPTLSGSISVCVGTTGIIYSTEAGQSNYTWIVSPGGTITSGGTATDNTVTITWITTGPQAVSVNYTDGNGCFSPLPTVRNVTVNALPVPTVTGILAVCEGATGVVYTTEAGQSNYVWTVSGGGVITAGGTAADNTVTVTWNAAGPQTVSVNYTDANGCTAVTPTITNVTVNATPVPTLAGLLNVCAGTTGVIYTTDAGQSNYTWTVSAGGTVTAGGTATDNTITVTWVTAGPQTISVNYTNASGCVAATPTALSVTVNPLPLPTLSGSTSVCSGVTGVVYTTEAGQSNYSWIVSAGGTITAGGTATDNTATVTWNTSGPQTVSVSYTDVNGCVPASATVLNVNVNSILAPTLTGSNAVCVGTTGEIYTTDAGQSNYTWVVSAGGTITAGGTATDNTVTVTWSTAGPQTVSVTYTDINGCSVPAPTILNVSVGTVPIPTLAGSITECEGVTGVIYATDIGQSNYTWAISAGGTITAGGSATDNTVTVTWATAGPQTVSVNYTSSGCTAATPTVLNVTVNALPVPTLTGLASACIGAANVTYTTEAGQSNYGWVISAGGTVTAGGTAADNTVTITWSASGPQSVSVNYTNAGGCAALVPTVQNVTVNDLPIPTLIGSTTVCAGSTNVIYTTEAAQSNYAWIVSAGGTITSGGTAPDNTVTITWTTAGPQTVSVNYTDGNGCSAITPAIVNVTVDPSPAPTLTGTASLCVGASTIVYTTEPGESNYTWIVSAGGTITAGGTATDNTVTVTWTTAGPQTVSINYSNAFGCTAITPTVLNVTVDDVPTATLVGNSSICVGQSGTLVVTLTGGGPWDIVYTDGSSNFTINNIATSPHSITVNPIITTSYSLISVTNATCGAGTVGGTSTITVNPIPGNPATFGSETWLGYVYDDSGDIATPLPGRINFAGTKYRGFIDATDIDNMSASSTYDITSDQFDLNPGNGTIFGPNVCGSYADDFSVRLRMQKTFSAGIYVFTVGSDDGVRLLVDGVNVITNPTAFNPHAYTVYQSTGICLTAGLHDIVIEYYERGGFSRLSFNYQLAPSPTVVTPVAVCINSPTAPTLTASSTNPGVTGFNWYADATLTTLLFSGANYTPVVPTELDLATVGLTDFYVTAVYACGETLASQVDVDVVNSATLTINDVTVCESGGIVDLTTLVTPAPLGGTFVFAGTNVTGNDFDPAGLSGLIPITVDYTIGTCAAPTGTLNVTVTNSSSITVPAGPVQACESGANIDLTTLVTGAPGGGIFTFTGTGVTGTTFDPSTLSGIQTITVDYIASGCAAPQTTFDINVTPNASITVTNGNICQNGGVVNLLTRVSGLPAGGNFTFAGAGVVGTSFDPTGLLGPVNIAVTYDVVGCSTANSTLVLTVLDPSNPLCGGGGINCSVFTVNVSSVRPTCSNQDDGSLTLVIGGGATSNKIIQLIKPNGVSFDTLTQIGPSGTYTFPNLSAANYQYLVQDFAGNICKQPYNLPLQTTVVATAVPSSFVNVSCFGEPTGQAVINASGSQTGQYFYSIDGLSWTLFTPGNVVSNLPPNGTYTILVGESIADACRDTVQVTINNINPAITATFNITAATCNGDDGAISNIVPAGGAGGPYEFSVDGGLTFQSGNSFTNLSGGAYTLLIRDVSGCTRGIPFNITFPGFVNFNLLTQNADCTNNGLSGSITVSITDVGVFRVAISTDQFNEPADASYLPYNNPFVTFNNLQRGQYFIYVKSTSAACPTRSAPININGVYAINFIPESQCAVDKPSLVLTGITGEPGVPITIEVYKKFTNTIVESLTLAEIPVTGSFTFDYNTFVFMQTPDDYQVRIIQVQSTVFCLLTSSLIDYTVPRRLTVGIGAVEESYPDIPTGSLQVINFDGGQSPYEIRIELDSASSFELSFYQTNFEVVTLNNNLQFEKRYKNIPAGRYKVQVIDQLGCAIELIARVPLDMDIFIPNIFTPNNDNLNDTFYIRNLPPNGGNRLVITNRWGKEVFSSKDYSNDKAWDGENVSDGVYYYNLQVSGSSSSITGWVEILRGQKP